jgi:hypothetical protein
MAKSPQSEKIIYLGQIQFVYRTQSFTKGKSMSPRLCSEAYHPPKQDVIILFLQNRIGQVSSKD